MTLNLEETLQWMAILVWGPILFLCLVQKYNDWLGTSNERLNATEAILKLLGELEVPIKNIINYYARNENEFVPDYVEDKNKAREHETRAVFIKTGKMLVVI